MLIHNPFGPIFSRELRATSRRRRSYVLRVVFLGGLLMFLVLAYLSSGAGLGQLSVTQRVQRQNQLGQAFFICFSIFCTGAMALVGPVLTCTAISSERLHKTLHVLLITPITAWQIVTGKLFSRLLIALTLMGLSLPVLALVRLLGGVELNQMFGALTLCAVTALLGASVGLLISTFVNRAYIAILFSYGSLLLLWVVLPVMILVPSVSGGPPPMATIRAISIISPLFDVVFISTPMGPLMATNWGWCAGLQIFLSGVMVTLSALSLRRIQRREGAAAAAVADTAPAAEQILAAPLTHRGRRRRDVGDNPVLWRELGRPIFPKRWHSIVAALVCTGVLLISYAVFGSQDAIREEELQYAYTCLFNGVAWMVFSVLAATAIAQEQESDTWTLLLATPMSPTAIVWGKIAGIYRRILWPALLVTGHLSLFALADVIGWWAVVSCVWVILTFNSVWVATGLYLSLVMRRMTFAVIVNLSLAVVLYLVIPILLAIVSELQVPRSDLADLTWWISPYYYLVEGIDKFSPDFRWTRSFNPPGSDGHATVGVLWQAIMFSGLIYVGVAVVIVCILLNRFNSIVGRANQWSDNDTSSIDASRSAQTT